MYIPAHFREADPDRLESLMDHYAFATLVSQMDGLPYATHLPLLLAAGEGPQGTLYGHLARANPHWRALAAGGPALAVFMGPHAYVSGTWYGSPNPPTWNYAAVHAYGTCTLLEDADATLSLLAQLTDRYDADSADPDGPVQSEETKRRTLAGLVAFRMEISEIQGKFKLSQNRSAADQQRIIARLGQSDDPAAHALSGLMLENLLRATLPAAGG